MPTTQANDDVADPGPDVTFRKLLAALLGSDLWSVRWVQGTLLPDCNRFGRGAPRGASPAGVAGWLPLLSCVRTPKEVAQRDEPDSR
jgi:hypothetical protein